MTTLNDNFFLTRRFPSLKQTIFDHLDTNLLSDLLANFCQNTTYILLHKLKKNPNLSEKQEYM